MAQVRLTTDALKDIEEIRAYIAKDSTRYADRQVQRFYAEIRKLERFPHVGTRSFLGAKHTSHEIMAAKPKFTQRPCDLLCVDPIHQEKHGPKEGGQPVQESPVLSYC